MRPLFLALFLPFLFSIGCSLKALDPLLSGYTPTDWVGDVENYTFSNGEIRGRKDRGGVIYTEKQYTDFVVRFEFQLPEGGNNGLAIRYPGEGNPAYDGMCELQVLDNSAEKFAKLDPRQYHGSAYGMVAAKRGHLKPVGEWNSQTVTVIGSKIQVVLNGELILDADLSNVSEFMGKNAYAGRVRSKGHFGFAGHHSPVAFRNIIIKEL